MKLQSQAREGRARLISYLGIMALVAFKLWLVHEEDIVGSATQFDALWYVRSASHWYWGTPYDWVAFIRPCAYPLWIASVHWLHLPLRLAIELFQLGGALLVTFALRRLGVRREICVAGLAAICLHPAGYQLNDYSMSDTFYAAGLWYVLGGLILTMALPRWWIAACTGVAIAVLWMTREEGVLLIAIVALWAFFCLRRGISVRLVVTTCLVATLMVVSFYTVNYSVFRSFARSEMTSRTFSTLFHSLLRIRTLEPKRYAPITAKALAAAFQVSPTFARLRPQLEGGMGQGWQTETFHRVGVRDEIGAGWIVWATRQAASINGYFASVDKAHHFFRKAAQEINRACDDGRLPTRFVVDGFLDPLAQVGGIGALPHSARRVAARFFGRWSIRAIADDNILTAAEASLYNEMTLRRSAGVGSRKGAAFVVERFIGRRYFIVSIACHLLAVGAVILLLWKRRQLPVRKGYGDAIVLLDLAVFLRAGLFSWLDATAFDGTEDRFLFPVLPLWIMVLLLIAGWSWSKVKVT
ncbi:MAG: hypothetical protein ABJB09_02500 [Verrucomicrobiota bacterium]